MLMPKKVKYRKQQRGRMKGVATRGNTVTHGTMKGVLRGVFMPTTLAVLGAICHPMWALILPCLFGIGSFSTERDR